MLIACASDAHGAKRQIDKLMGALPAIDVFCFLGDCDRDASYIEDTLMEAHPNILLQAVAGNNDPFSRRSKTELVWFSDTHTMLTHGHLFHVKAGTSFLQAAALKQGCKLVLFGHTHQPYHQSAGVILVNPGALLKGQWALNNIGEKVQVSLRVL